MKKVTIRPQVRKEEGSKQVSKLRKSGFVPAMIYDAKPVQVKISVKDMNSVLSSGSVIVDLEFENKKLLAQVRKVQWDITHDNVNHVDIFVISSDQWIDVDVPILLKGEPKGIADGGVLERGIRTIKLQCKPDQIPEKIIVDVSGLELNQKKRVQDVQLPQNTKLKTTANIVIAGCVKPLEVALPTPADAAAAAAEPPKEPEVVKKEKKEDQKLDEAEAASKKK